jgi:uncharacterized OB-fold protein
VLLLRRIILPPQEDVPELPERKPGIHRIEQPRQDIQLYGGDAAPPSNYLGPVPYAFGWVELPDGIRVETLFTGCRLEDLRIGMAVEMVIETLHTDSEGREIVCHKFKPVEETA